MSRRGRRVARPPGPEEEHVLPDEDKIVEAVRQVLSATLVT